MRGHDRDHRLSCPLFPEVFRHALPCFPLSPTGRTHPGRCCFPARLRDAVDPAGRRDRDAGSTDAHRFAQSAAHRKRLPARRGRAHGGQHQLLHQARGGQGRGQGRLGDGVEHRADHRPAARPGAGHQPEPAPAGGPVGAARPARTHLSPARIVCRDVRAIPRTRRPARPRTAGPGDRRRGRAPDRGSAHCHRGPAPAQGLSPGGRQSPFFLGAGFLHARVHGARRR